MNGRAKPSTVKCYKMALDHYEVTYGYFLPTSAAAIIEYLSKSITSFSPGTLQVHISALSDWHNCHGFDDPTEDDVVREFMRHIKRTSSHMPRRHRAVAFTDLIAMDEYLNQNAHDQPSEMLLPPSNDQLRSLRDRVILLLGYWLSLSANQTVSLDIKDILINVKGMLIDIPGSNKHQSKIFVPYLKHHCPVRATEEWIEAMCYKNGPLVRSISRWGEIKTERIRAESVSNILAKAARKAGVKNRITSSSLTNGLDAIDGSGAWDRMSILEHVGWRDKDRDPWTASNLRHKTPGITCESRWGTF